MSQQYKPGIIKGYKATDSEMKCRGLQYKLNEWQEVADGDIIKCGANGLHFCEQPSGVWSYYSDPGTRVFEVEAEFVLDDKPEPGADAKSVARRIRLVREISITGNRNTGNRNTGHYNTGHYNTGHYNTGDSNTGHYNTGHYNTGHYNTGDSNTGDSNTGDSNTGNSNTGNRNTGNRNRNTGNRNSNTGNSNTGNRNTGNRNTGNRNTGHYNTGNSNTGDSNTGDGNAANFCSGFFCSTEPNVLVFDVDSGLTRDAFMLAYPEYWALSRELLANDPIDFNRHSRLPGITPEKLSALHAKHIAGRR